MTKMPHSRKWQRSLGEIYGNKKSGELVSKAQSKYKSFCQQYSGQKWESHQIELRKRILPGLSIYSILLEENSDRERVFSEVEILFRAAFFQNRMRGIHLLNLLPDPFPVIRPVLRMMTRNEYMRGSQELIEDSKDCFAVNVYRCLILDILTEQDAAELTALYCKTDDWLAESLPRVGWERKKTLGRGDDCCDFRWCRRTP